MDEAHAPVLLNGVHSGLRTDHDRHQKEKDDGPAETAANQTGGSGPDQVQSGDAAANGHQPPPHSSSERPPPHAPAQRMNDLPDSIVHITQDFIPLSLLLTRLAQTSHNALQDKILELARMPLPATVVNGHTGTHAVDDSSAENVKKKAVLLHFLQDMHAKWVKALVITEWSRKSEVVSKLIDLKAHMDRQRFMYDMAVETMITTKASLVFARLPNPDLKTALQVLLTGAAAWLPDLHFTSPPPLSAKESLKWMEEINTLLSIRLNLDDYDKIPASFRQYRIQSGRVTFAVPGEFEVDLTIADEDYQSQFWFLDFRFAFSPASTRRISDTLRSHIEARVNAILAEPTGLSGCYDFLHEFTLTHKINHIKALAIELNRSSWTGTLVVEPLNRALAIQYWASRPGLGPKSWILIAVNNGRHTGAAEPSSTSIRNANISSTSFRSTSTSSSTSGQKPASQLTVQWFRSGKEVRDADIPFDTSNLSAEALLKVIIGQHIFHLLSGVYIRLLATDRFKSRATGLALSPAATTAPEDMRLTIQAGWLLAVTLTIEPITGAFYLLPPLLSLFADEKKLNLARDPIEDGVVCLETIRWKCLIEELGRHGRPLGWATVKSPLGPDAIKLALKPRGLHQAVFLQRHGWPAAWFLVLCMSQGGDIWWLVEVNFNGRAPAASFCTTLPLRGGFPLMTETFWHQLTVYSTGVLFHCVNLRELHRKSIKHATRPGGRSQALPKQVHVPPISITLSPAVPSNSDGDVSNGSGSGSSGDTASLDRSQRLWARSKIDITYKGIRMTATPFEAADDDPHHAGAVTTTATKKKTAARESEADGRTMCYVSTASILVQDPAKFALLDRMVDPDLAYNPKRGEFSFRMVCPVGTPILDTLARRLDAIDRLVHWIEAVGRTRSAIVCQSIQLRTIVFTYPDLPDNVVESRTSAPEPSIRVPQQQQQQPPPPPLPPQVRRWRAVLNLSHDVVSLGLEVGNPHARTIDFLSQMANDRTCGFDRLISWLPMTLELLTGLDRMARRWDAAQGRHDFGVFVRTLDWLAVHYTLTDAGGSRCRLRLALSLRLRRFEPWWHVAPLHAHLPARQPQQYQDDLTTYLVLRRIWNARGTSYVGLASSAAARARGGVLAMLAAIDDTVWDWAANGCPPPEIAHTRAPLPALVGAPARQPDSRAIAPD